MHPELASSERIGKPGTCAANCLLARRLAERGVRFIASSVPRRARAVRPGRIHGISASGILPGKAQDRVRPRLPPPVIIEHVRATEKLRKGSDRGHALSVRGT
ncbi:MAG: hypothetical protein DMG07_23605 [Acidobacteria bacterium]|nr:MAG: hypothetical protein DMG07_23605 [Acidobacteriota bacterium]